MGTANDGEGAVALENETEAREAGPKEAEAAASTSVEEAPTRDPARRLTWVLLGVAVLAFIWYVAADRVAPSTNEARVQAWIIPITPEISGRVTRVDVAQDERVEQGQLLAVIDPEHYEIAVHRAEAALDLAGQGLGAGVATVNLAQAEVVEAQAELAKRELHFTRTRSLAEKGVVSDASLDKARSDRDKANAQASSAQAELERAKQRLGPEGNANPRVRDALAALRQARIDLARTEIRAPTAGGVTNLRIEQGYYAKAGTPIMTFVSFEDVWVEANLREKSVAHVRPGDPVEMTLDSMPGEIFAGKVFSTGFAVQQPWVTEVGEAVVVRSPRGWLRDAQRFPVVIHFDRETFPRGVRRAGGQAGVQIYTEESNWLLNGLGWLWIRLKGWLAYVY